jgi:hypothetical protein
MTSSIRGEFIASLNQSQRTAKMSESYRMAGMDDSSALSANGNGPDGTGTRTYLRARSTDRSVSRAE